MWSIFSRDSSKDFPFEIEPDLDQESRSIWNICKGRRKAAPHEEITVFIYDIKSGNDVKLDLAKLFVKRLKTLRHPGILQFVASVETDKVLVATERVVPLAVHLKKLELKGKQLLFYLSWGIFQITRALNFLIKDCNLRHNNVSSWSVFVNYAGEWKLGGLEYVSPMDGSPLPPVRIPPSLEVYDPPEKADQSRHKFITKHSTDMWGLGCLLWEAFNGPLLSRGNLKETQNLPKNIIPLYVELVGANPSNRPNPQDILTKCQKPNGFFRNDLIDTLLFLEEIQIKDKSEKGKFFAGLTDQLDNLPENVCRHKILPQVLTSYEYGDAGSSILAPLFKLGRLLEESEYQAKIVPCVVKLFGATDRVTRSRLLLQMELFVPHLQPSVVNDQIFPQVAHGFMDTNPTIREQTVKSIIHLAPKLNYNNLNVEVLKHFARLQARDDQGGIRTNTTVCLGKIAANLHPEVRQRVLISAFVRAVRDPFPPARVAGILALAATQQYYLLSDVAMKILPNMFPLTMDPDKTVRDPAFKTIKGFLSKLERVSEDPSLKEQFEADVSTATPSLSNSTATWTGWAVSAVTSKFYKSQNMPNPSSKSTSQETGAEKTLNKQDSSGSINSNNTSVASFSSKDEKEVSDDEEEGNGWEKDNWGDMDSSVSALAKDNSQFTVQSSATDGWEEEDDDWGSIEDNTAPIQPVPARQESLPQLSKLNISKPQMTERKVAQAPIDDGWGEADFEPIDNNKNDNSNWDPARQKREEKKQQRLKELEAKRAARGPMKLGVSNKDKFLM